MSTNSSYLETDGAGFDSAVLKSELPVLVAFATQWSRPCQILEPVLEEIAFSCAERLKVVWINADENPDLGLWYGIHAVPTIVYFVNGSVRGRIVGTASKTAMLSKLEAVSKDDADTRRHHDA